MNSTLTAQITHCLFYHWTVTWAVLLAYCADASPLVSSQTRATRQSKTTPAHVQRLLCVYSSQPRYCNWDILSRGQCLLQLVWTTTLTRQAATLAWSIWVCVVLYWIQKHAGKKQEKCMKVHEETAQVQCMRQVCEEITWRQLHEEKCCTNVAKVQKSAGKLQEGLQWIGAGVVSRTWDAAFASWTAESSLSEPDCFLYHHLQPHMIGGHSLSVACFGR